MKGITTTDILDGLERLGLVGERVVVHSSLSSFGNVEGGAETVATACTSAFELTLMPAFTFESNSPPPPDERPSQNGCDYAFYDGWERPLVPFRVERAGVDKKMGAVSRYFAALPQTRRSDHPWHSWAAQGTDADLIVRDHSWGTTNPPLERLADLGGYVLLMGVTFSSCTAIHVAEERAGRRPFIRWATDRNGEVRRVRASGCAKGFDALMPYFQDYLTETQVGTSRMIAAPLAPLIEHAARLINANPRLTSCSDTCIRCRDSALGGPVGELATAPTVREE
jgi:aminoglycoside 3-N-acetyltransferase